MAIGCVLGMALAGAGLAFAAGDRDPEEPILIAQPHAGTVQSGGGSVEIGQACANDHACRTGRCDTTVSPRRCIPHDGKGRVDDYCTHPNHCAGPDLVCVGAAGTPIWSIARAGSCVRPHQELGEECFPNFDDDTSVFKIHLARGFRTLCKSGRCDIDQEVCIPNDGVGRTDDFCTHPNQCSEKLCVAQKCRRPASVALGGICSGLHQACRSGVCDGSSNPTRCVPANGRGQIGDYCTHPNHCATNHCSDKKCAGVGGVALGGGCSNDSQCVSGRCDTTRSPRLCIPRDGTGVAEDYCNHDNHCIGGICLAESCRAPGSVDLGKPCGSYHQVCQSGRCDGGVRKCVPNDGAGRSGDYCTHPNQCASKLCLNSACAGGDRSLGATCSNDSQCVSMRCDTTTSPRKCIPHDGTGRKGDYCTHNNHCRSGNRCNVRQGERSGTCTS
jgi:hypothetical protein